MGENSKIEWTDAMSPERVGADAKEHARVVKQCPGDQLVGGNSPLSFKPFPNVLRALGAIARGTCGHNVAWLAQSILCDGNNMVPCRRRSRAIGAIPTKLFCENFLGIERDFTNPAFARICVLSALSPHSKIGGIPTARVFIGMVSTKSVFTRRRPRGAAPAPSQSVGDFLNSGNPARAAGPDCLALTTYVGAAVKPALVDAKFVQRLVLRALRASLFPIGAAFNVFRVGTTFVFGAMTHA